MTRRLAPLFFGVSLAAAGVSSCSSGGDKTPQGCANISGAVSAGPVSIRKPEEDVGGCHEIPNPMQGGVPMICERKTPDLACVGQSEPLGTPINVTFTGCVASFGLEAQSDLLTVTVMREFLPGGTVPVDPGYDLMGQPDMQTENTPAAFIAKTISQSTIGTNCVDLGGFELDGVPTETPLIVRVGDQNFPNGDRTYVDTYQYNIILRNSAIRSGPRPDDALVPDPATACAMSDCYVVDDVNTIAKATFVTVALAAGVSDVRGDDDLYDGDGQGHLAGEVQDCTSQDTVQNAVVALDTDSRKLAYFNVGFPPDPDNLEDPKVEGTRTRTNADGLYAAIAVDVPRGGKPVTVGAAVTKSVCGPDGICKCDGAMENPAYTGPDTGENEVLPLGTRQVYVFPDSITILTFDRELYVTR